ncbi:TRAM domain-containing protein [Spirochaetia bacterium 38H-sp]|uniref:TRAM domain-containing protein n=1 Tax=Rarispira pelagica TaxID=3141764 RepID=A0ABU9UB91_9SPIR
MQNTVELTIEELAPLARGISRHEGKIIFTDYTLPGEKVLAVIKEEHKDYATAELIEIITGSAHRVKPHCPHYGICKGCNMQHIEYQHALEYKKNWLRKLLTDNKLTDIPHIETISSSPYGYRNRFQIHIENKKPGYRKKDGRHFPINQCPILNQAAAPIFSDDFSDIPNKKRLNLFCHNNRLYGRKGAEDFSVTMANRTYYGRTDLFFQSNTEVLEKLIQWIEEKTENMSPLSVWDLYSGSGLFSSLFADRAESVKLVEEVTESLALAERQLGKKANYYAMTVEEFFSYPAASKPPDLIILDPPRSGISKSARKSIIKTASPTLLYISCNPASFARDAAQLIRHSGYRIKDIVLCDFYPQTHHAEIASILQR